MSPNQSSEESDSFPEPLEPEFSSPPDLDLRGKYID
jgi:hypothetical protein